MITALRSDAHRGPPADVGVSAYSLMLRRHPTRAGGKKAKQLAIAPEQTILLVVEDGA